MIASRVITYSPAHTLVPTYECYNRCTYCNFRADLGSVGWMSLATAETTLRSLSPDIREILILSGEVHPQSPTRSDWFEHIYHLCELALGLGFLPHTNVGPLSYGEMQRLKSVNVSMGLMLEQSTPHLLQTVHRHAPSKDPQLRLQQLQQAGKLKIPFTTGILLGLGETEADWRESLATIAQVQAQWGHLQECILQPYSPGSQEVEIITGFDLQDLPRVVAIAREILPDSIVIQIPPNLVTQPDILLACLESGARDLGGISPIDEVNPDYPHPTAIQLRSVLEPAGWQLVERLPVYPQYRRWVDSIEWPAGF
jgi:7,8-didemethyl-8-hydroxy-5-deazariboflavin synthase